MEWEGEKRKGKGNKRTAAWYNTKEAREHITFSVNVWMVGWTVRESEEEQERKGESVWEKGYCEYSLYTGNRE